MLRPLAGYEPHSVLPLGMCIFLPHARGMPASLTNTIVAATSTVGLAARPRLQRCSGLRAKGRGGLRGSARPRTLSHRGAPTAARPACRYSLPPACGTWPTGWAAAQPLAR